MSSTWLGSNKFQFSSYWFVSTRVRTVGFESHDLPKAEAGRSAHLAILSGTMMQWTVRPVSYLWPFACVSCLFWGFTSYWHLRSYQDGHWLFIVYTHGEYIVLPKSKNQAATPMTPSVTLSGHWANQSLPYPKNAEWLARKLKVPILKLWFDSTKIRNVGF